MNQRIRKREEDPDITRRARILLYIALGVFTLLLGRLYWLQVAQYDRYRNLSQGLERMLCPRVHLKCAVVDGEFAYTGSANLTGAGVGAKSARRRNFESGIITDEQTIVSRVMEQFDAIWRGSHCRDCDRKEYCDEHAGILSTRRGEER